MSEAVGQALIQLNPAAAGLNESGEELLARAQEQLDVAARLGLQQSGSIKEPLLSMIALLGGVIHRAYAECGKSITDDEVAEEINDGVASAKHKSLPGVPGRLIFPEIHNALIELHRQNGRFVRIADDRSCLEVAKGAAMLAGQIAHAVDTGRIQLLSG